jgi:hypothetical protein
MPRFFRTLMLIEVLGNEPYTGGIEDLAAATIDGGFSGTVLMESTSEVAVGHMAALLVMQGSDPDFLGADDQDDESAAVTVWTMTVTNPSAAEGVVTSVHYTRPAALTALQENYVQPWERTCILTGAPGEDPDDCTTHRHEDMPEDVLLAHVASQGITVEITEHEL